MYENILYRKPVCFQMYKIMVILVLFQTVHNEDPLLVQGGQKSITYRSKSFHPRVLGTPQCTGILDSFLN